MLTSSELAETIKAEIVQLMDEGVFPPDVRDFSVLHEYVDANTLGQMEALFDELSDLYLVDGEPVPGEVFPKSVELFIEIASPAMHEVDLWLKRRTHRPMWNGMPRVAVLTRLDKWAPDGPQ
jgi:uncharacterized protein YozE (UPF0346 family)